MNIKRLLLTPNPFSRPDRKVETVKGIVLHWLENAGQSAVDCRNYFEGLKHQVPVKKDEVDNNRYASAHFIIDVDGSIVQCLSTSDMGHHCGAVTYSDGIFEKLGAHPNTTTIGIEMCHKDWTGEFSAATLKSAADLCISLCDTFNLDRVDDLYRHFDVTGKICPQFWVKNPEFWGAFKNTVLLG